MDGERKLWWIWVPVVWPVAIISAAFIWPGPERPALQYRYFERPAYERATPPVDTLGAKGELTVSDAEGSARIFWSQPESGKVELTIEVPPEEK